MRAQPSGARTRSGDLGFSFFDRFLIAALSGGAVASRRNWQTGGMTMTDPVTAGTGPVVGEPCVLLKQGEIFLKGRNREQFERMLHAHVRRAVRGTGVSAELSLREGVLVLRVARNGLTQAEHAAAVDRIAERAADVPGIVRVCRALRVDKTPEAAIAASLALTDAGSGSLPGGSRGRAKRVPRP